MGQEIPHSQLSREDFQRFQERLQQETALLADLLVGPELSFFSIIIKIQYFKWLFSR